MSISKLILSAIRQKSFKYYLLTSIPAAILTYGVFALFIFGTFPVALGIAKLIGPACFLLVGLLCNFACAIFAQKKFNQCHINDERRDSLMGIEDENRAAYSFVKRNAHYQLGFYFAATVSFTMTTLTGVTATCLLLQIFLSITSLGVFLTSSAFEAAKTAALEDHKKTQTAAEIVDAHDNYQVPSAVTQIVAEYIHPELVQLTQKLYKDRDSQGANRQNSFGYSLSAAEQPGTTQVNDSKDPLLQPLLEKGPVIRISQV
jgi:hypothetical protein